MTTKKLFSNKIKQLKTECKNCYNYTEMNATGNLFKYENSKHWVIEFFCSVCNEKIEKWNLEFEPLIQEVLKEEGIEN